MNEKMNNHLQRSIISQLYDAEWLSVNKYHSGDILTRVTSDVGSVVSFFSVVCSGIVAFGVQLMAAFITLFVFDRNLALFTFVLGPISVIASFIYGRKIKKMQHKFQEAESKCRSKIQESIHNMLIIKTFNFEEQSMVQITENQNERYRWAIKKNILSVRTNIILGSGYWAGYFAAFTWGAFKLSKGISSFGTFTAFLQLVGQVQGPFIGLSKLVPQFASSLASVERLMELEELEKESGVESPPFLLQNIQALFVKDISFGYKKERTVLSHLSFSVKAGEISALVGISGEGKTTIMRLLLSLMKPDSGELYLLLSSGEHIKLSHKTRHCFAYVPQGNTLFSGSIRENLLVGNNTAQTNQMEEALRASCAWEFIESLPEKMDTLIGESGMGLSEGQAQRLSIARALLKESSILLLDEATSALDLETEKTVLNNIRIMNPKRTCIAITHRSSVIDICDRVFRISDKKLEEEVIPLQSKVHGLA